MLGQFSLHERWGEEVSWLTDVSQLLCLMNTFHALRYSLWWFVPAFLSINNIYFLLLPVWWQTASQRASVCHPSCPYIILAASRKPCPLPGPFFLGIQCFKSSFILTCLSSVRTVCSQTSDYIYAAVISTGLFLSFSHIQHASSRKLYNSL